MGSWRGGREPEPEIEGGKGAGAGGGGELSRRRRRQDRAAGPPPRGPPGKRRVRRSIPGRWGAVLSCGPPQSSAAGVCGGESAPPWQTLVGGVLPLQEIREEPLVLDEPAQRETGAGGTCQEREKAALLDPGQPTQPSAKD